MFGTSQLHTNVRCGVNRHGYLFVLDTAVFVLNDGHLYRDIYQNTIYPCALVSERHEMFSSDILIVFNIAPCPQHS